MFGNSKGFSLIELMIVVVIIGILAAVAIPNYISMQNRAKESSVKANAHSVQLVVEDYSVRHNGIYPALADIVPDRRGDHDRGSGLHPGQRRLCDRSGDLHHRRLR
jgi:prepilin-type N-terminal cleavage/methylation domain-containing protein